RDDDQDLLVEILVRRRRARDDAPLRLASRSHGRAVLGALRRTCLRALLRLLALPLGARRRAALLGPRLAVPHHREVRVPARHRAEDEPRALAVAGRDVADPVDALEADRVLAARAASPERGGGGSAHRATLCGGPPSLGCASLRAPSALAIST